MKSKESKLARCTHELVGAHRRASQGMGEKQATAGDSHPVECRGREKSENLKKFGRRRYPPTGESRRC